MTSKEYLSQLRNLDLRIDQKLSELGDLRMKASTLGGIDYTKDRVQTSPPPDAPYAQAVQKIIDLDEEVNAEVDQFVNMKHEIIGQIQEMEDPRFVDLLYKRYVEYKPFEMIAREMNYVYRYAVQLHGEALTAFEAVYGPL